ncbi:hypothetical protein HK103_006235 [Boothiomyces macroporosus]|uniref:Uncharacterized protein n=1 Tax=Boothiomyces macroporosus TaxID=261099 RepID=A0AAD5UEE3_9FUNG|nr:hypothetical protein HK103_006235 [Boothiomyces macroporosus]
MNSTSQLSDTPLIDATVILFIPFISIPALIISFRLFKYFYRLYKARLYGIGNAKELLQNPLTQLGLGREEIAIRKENRKILKTQLKLELKNKIQKQESDSLLGRQVIAAEQYFEILKTQSMKTWYDLLSPTAVRTYLETSKYARWWMFLQLTVTILSIGNYITLTYMTNSNDTNGQSIIKTMDMIYPIVFCLDYALGFYISDDKLKFYYSPLALISLLSIVTPYVNLFAETPTKYVWLLGFIRIFRAIRLLKIYELLSYTQTETSKQLTLFALNFFCFIFFSTSIINATEALNFAIESASMKYWHDALYYIIEEFSGTSCDLVPTNTISRSVMMVLILVAMTYIPWHVFKIIDLFNSKNKFQRNPFKPKRRKSHTFFTFDSESSIVLLFDQPPELNVRHLLANPLYQSRIKYIQGNPLNFLDLQRSVIQRATALFLVGKVHEQNTGLFGSPETKLLQMAMFIKRNYPGLQIFSLVDFIKSKSICKDYGVEIVVCVNQIKAELAALNAVYPGVQCLLTNLFQPITKIGFVSSAEKWIKEYQCGAANQVHVIKVPLGLVGMEYIELVKEFYRSRNIMVIGKMENLKYNSRVGQSTILKEDDSIYCITDESEEALIQVGLEYEDPFVPNKHVYHVIDEIEKTANISSEKNAKLDVKNDPFNMSTFNSIPDTLENHIVLAGNLNVEIITIFVHKLRLVSPFIPVVIVYNHQTKTNKKWDGILGNRNVFVISGHLSVEMTMDRVSLNSCKKLVLYSESSDPETIYLIKVLYNLYPNIEMNIELYDGSALKYFESNNWENDIEHIKTKTLVNTCSLNLSERKSYYQSTRNRVKSKSVTANLLAFFFTRQSLGKNDSKLDQQADVTDIYLNRMNNLNSYDEISKCSLYQLESTFASGKVFTSTFPAAFLAHAYFKPYITQVFQGLMAELHLLDIDHVCVGKPFIDLFEKLLSKGYLALGLYRFNNNSSYVYTNCRKGDIVSSKDRVYVLRVDK